MNPIDRFKSLASADGRPVESSSPNMTSAFSPKRSSGREQLEEDVIQSKKQRLNVLMNKSSGASMCTTPATSTATVTVDKLTTSNWLFSTITQNAILQLIKPQLIFIVLFLCLPIKSKALSLQPTLLENTYADIEGRSALITCTDEQRKPNSYLRWTRYDNRVISNDNPRLSAKPVGGDPEKLGLFVTEIQKGDAGDYHCQLIDKETHQIHESILLKFVVYNKIVFLGQTLVTAREYESFSMLCRIMSDPNIKSLGFSWSKNGTKLTENKNNTRFVMTRRDVSTSILTIKNITRKDAGLYSCEAAAVYDLKFQISNWAITLDTRYPPLFPAKASKVWIPAQRNTSEVNITCSVDANPRASYSWETGGRSVSRGTLGDQYIGVVDEGNRSVLRLNMPDDESKFGPVPVRNFLCRARNEEGSDSHQFEIKQGNFPSAPEVISSEMVGRELILVIRETKGVIPKVDYYKIEMQDSNLSLLFNASIEEVQDESNNVTYRVPLRTVPSGSHKFSVIAHNPVGYSKPLDKPEFALVISGASVVEKFSYLMLLSIVLKFFENRVYFL